MEDCKVLKKDEREVKLFKYSIMNLIDRLDNYTSIFGASRTQQVGEKDNATLVNLFDAVRITEDDIIIIEQLSKKVITELSNKLYTYVRPFDDVIYRKIEGYICISLCVKVKDVQFTDNQIEEYLFNAIMAEWLRIKKPDEMQIFALQAASISDSILSKLHERRGRIKLNDY